MGTLMLNVDKITMKEVYYNDQMTFDCYNCKTEYIDADVTNWTKNITAPNPKNGYYYIGHVRTVHRDDIKRMKLDLMPGFRLTWKYNEQIETEAKYVNDGTAKEFVRFVNMLKMTKLDKDNIWKIVKKTRLSFLLTNPDQDCSGELLSDGNIQYNINNLAEKLKLDKRQNTNVSNKIIFKTAAEMFLYLNFCPSLMPKFILLQSYLFGSGTPTEIILALASLMKTSQNVDEKRYIIEVFGKLMESLNLESYKIVQSITKWKCYSNSTFGNCTNIDSNKSSNTTNFKTLQKLTNHPVHIIDENGELSPTALIPFCEFGGNMSVMGVKINQFDVPVCNSFRPKIIRDQLCYTVDPNEYKHKIDLKGELSLSFYIHYNEDRQMEDADNSQDKYIIVDTIEPLELSLDMEHNLNVIKEIKVTDSFLSLDEYIRGCKKGSYDECSSRNYMNTLLNKCQCLPFQLSLTNKTQLCTAEDLDCVSSIKVDKEDNSECFQQCSGILITSYNQKKIDDRISNVVREMIDYISKTSYILQNLAEQFIGFETKSDIKDKIIKLSANYWKYKGFYNFSSQFKEYELERPNLKYVKIQFNAPVFDKVTKDRSAKFVDQLSAIGGTMGLLTVFSIISGVEIIYFVVKIAMGYLNESRQRKL